MLDKSMLRLRGAIATAVSRADDVLESADALTSLAVSRAKAQMTKSLLDDDVLSSLYRNYGRDEDGDVALRALSRWLLEHFELEPVQEPGVTKTVPDDRLRAYHVRNPEAKGAGQLHHLRVVASGWKRGNKVLRLPVAEFVQADS